MSDYNTKITVYPSGQSRVIYANQNIFHRRDEIDYDGWIGEPEKLCDSSLIYSGPTRKRCLASEADTREDSILRSKRRLFDIAFSNEWDYFFTGTFDPLYIDFTDPVVVRKKISKWMSNMVQRKGLRYLLVPERFKSGTEGIHFHCLCNDVFDLEFSGKYHKLNYAGAVSGPRIKVYNVTNWKYGFSTAVPISGEKVRLCCYVTKYIAKDSNRIFGKYYLSSNNLNRDGEVMYANTNFDNLELQSYPAWRDSLLLKYENNISFTTV